MEEEDVSWIWAPDDGREDWIHSACYWFILADFATALTHTQIGLMKSSLEEIREKRLRQVSL